MCFLLVNLSLLYNFFLQKARLTLSWNNGNDPVDDSKSERADSDTDRGVEDGVFGFFDFASVAGGGNVVDAANNDEYDGDKPDDADDGV